MVDEALLLGVELARSSVSQEVRKSYNRIQWGPQLMAHTGEKLALQSGCAFDFTVAELELAVLLLDLPLRLLALRDVTDGTDYPKTLAGLNRA